MSPTPTGSRTPPELTTVGRYLATRLRQLGVDHLFGLPGDFNLALIDEVLGEPGLEWVGSTNELNAAYAADGYARRRGVGALITTFGVGELSAINGVAGSYAESVPVLQVTGAPATTLADAGTRVHHTLIDGDFGHFSRAYAEVTVAAECLTAEAPGAQIDRVLAAMVAASKPGYLSIPADLVCCPVPAAPLRRPLPSTVSDPASLAAFAEALADHLADHLAGTGEVTVLAGHLVRRRRLHHLLEELAHSGGAAVTYTLGGQGVGGGGGGPYVGALTPEAATRRMVEECGTLIVAGVVFSDITSGMFSHHVEAGRGIHLGLDRATVGSATFNDVRLEDTLRLVVEALVGVERPATVDAQNLRAGGGPRAVPTAVPASSSTSSTSRCPLTHAQLWAELERWIPPGTTVLADAGTAYYGAAGMRLAPGCEVVGQPYWSSIGYTLPALLGTELAAPGSRPVLLIGDGAAQLTVQELATILHRRLDVVIIVLNNGGYTIERKIRSPDAVYQDITPWDWTALPAALGQPELATTAVVRDHRQLSLALAAADASRSGPTLLEVRLDRDDAPPLLAAIARGLHPGATDIDHRQLPRSA